MQNMNTDFNLNLVRNGVEAGAAHLNSGGERKMGAGEAETGSGV